MRGGPAVRGAQCAAAATSGRGSVVRCGDIGRPISPAEATAANVRSIAAFAIFGCVLCDTSWNYDSQSTVY